MYTEVRPRLLFAFVLYQYHGQVCDFLCHFISHKCLREIKACRVHTVYLSKLLNLNFHALQNWTLISGVLCFVLFDCVALHWGHVQCQSACIRNRGAPRGRRSWCVTFPISAVVCWNLNLDSSLPLISSRELLNAFVPLGGAIIAFLWSWMERDVWEFQPVICSYEKILRKR